jgi:hypothetical protein
MRRYLAVAALFSCLCAFVGCRHVAGVCDCVPDPSLNYWGCPGWSAGCAACGAPGQPTPPPPPAVQPEALKVMPKPDDTAK